MADRLTEARQRLHGHLADQARERAVRTMAGHTQQFGPAMQALKAGNTAQAASLWEQHHPGAMSQGNLPGWLKGAAQVPAGGIDNFQAAPRRIDPGAGAMGPGGHLNGLPEHAPTAFNGQAVPEHFPATTPNLIHLGGGIFLHPETGQIHGLPAAGTANPLMNALHAVSPTPAIRPISGPPVAI